MRILVTGGAGYIGSHAVRLFLARGHDVWVYDNLSMGHRAAVPADRLIVGDLAETHRLDHALVTAPHRGGGPLRGLRLRRRIGDATRPSITRTTLSTRWTCSTRLRRHGIGRVRLLQHLRHLRHSGDGADHRGRRRRRRSTPTATPSWRSNMPWPTTPRPMAGASRPCATSTRPGASPDGDIGEDHDPETHLIPLVLQAALGQRPHIEVFGTDYPTPDGTCIRDYIHVDDLAEAHLLALETAGSRASSCATTWAPAAATASAR